MQNANEVKPIETLYDGYRFRSRLEARFAVFCNKLGIEYIYEPEGYMINGIRYLPDFYLPDLDVHVEVKGKRKGYEGEVWKTRQFIQWGGPIKTIVFVSEIPDTPEWGLPCFPAFYWTVNGVDVGWFQFWGEKHSYVNLTAGFPRPQIHQCTDDIDRKHFEINPISDYLLSARRNEQDPDEMLREPGCKRYWVWRKQADSKALEAYKAARSARFEHGEKG